MTADLPLLLAAISTGAALGCAGMALLLSLAEDRPGLRALLPLALGSAGLAAIALAGQIALASIG